MKVEIKCSYCGRTSLKLKGGVNRSKKNNAKLFCDKICSGLAKRQSIDSDKECNGCKSILSPDNFRIRKKPDGRLFLAPLCRKCESEYNSVHLDKENKKNRERIRFQDNERRNKKNEFQREWRKKKYFKEPSIPQKTY